MSTVAALLVTIGADISSLQRGLRDTETQINSFASNVSSTISSIGGSFVRAGAAADVLGAPIRQIGLDGLETASNFQSAMAEISARTGIVGSDLENISNFALQMGADTAFSAQQAADAFLQLLSSGQSAEEAMSTLPLVLDAAAASGENLGTTADTLTDIMAAFGLPIEAMTPQLQAAAEQFGVTDQMLADWGDNIVETTPQLEAMAASIDLTTEEMADLIFGTEDAQDVVNALAQAAGASSADMASLGQAFSNVGGVAKGFGLSVNDTAAILAIFAENGIKGAESGTQLRSMLLNMTRDTEDTQEAWTTLGTSLYDAEGNLRDFETVIGELDTALDALPVEEQNKLMKQLGGSYGILGITALRGSISISDMTTRMSEQATAAEVAQARMDTFKGRMDSLMGSVETLMITALTPLMEEVLTPLAEVLTDVINGIVDWSTENPELSNTLVAIGGALALIGPVLIGVGTAMTLAAPAVGILAAAFGLLLSPIALVAAGIAGLIYVASQLIDFTALGETIQSGVSGVLESIDWDGGTGFDLTGLQTSITEGFTTLDLSTVPTTMETHFNDILSAIVSVAGIVFGGPVGMAIGAASLVGKAIETDFLGIGTFLESSGISSAVTEALNSVKATIDSVISSVFGGAQQGPQAAAPLDITGALLPDAEQGLGGPLGLLVSDLQRGFEALKGIADNVVANIMPGLTSLGDGIKGFIDNLAGTETDGLLRVVTAIVGFVGGIAAKGVELGSEVLGELLTTVGNALPALGSFINNFISSISNMGEGDWGEAFTNLADSLINIGQAALDFFGIELQIPDFAAALEGWQTFGDSLGIIISFVGDQINSGLNDIAVGARSFIRDIEELLSRAQVAGADLNNLLGRGSAENDAAREAGLANIGAIEAAEGLEQQIRDSLMAGDLSIDMSQFLVSDPAAVAAKIADPVLIQEALNTALAEGDQATFDVLAPVAMALGIDTEDLAAQYQAGIDAAAASTTFTANISANIRVSGATIDWSAVSGSMSAVQTAVNMGQSVAVPALASGGMVQSGGMAYIHPGEAILPADVTRNVPMGNGQSGGNTFTIQTNDADQLINDLKRQGIDLYAMANPA